MATRCKKLFLSIFSLTQDFQNWKVVCSSVKRCSCFFGTWLSGFLKADEEGSILPGALSTLPMPGDSLFESRGFRYATSWETRAAWGPQTSAEAEEAD